MKRLCLTVLLIALVLAVPRVRATDYVTSTTGSKWSGHFTLGGILGASDNSLGVFREHFLMEFQGWNDTTGQYEHCPYWPPSYCSWEVDTGDVTTALLSSSITGSAGAIVGRFVTWIDYYTYGSYYTTYTDIQSWP